MINEGQQPDGRYCRRFRLGATEVDRFNRLRLMSLLGFFQETAGDQCELYGSGWETLWNRHGLCYIVVRMEVRMERYPGTGETICVDTWPDPRLRMIFTRYGEIFDDSGVRVGAIVSQWALLDVNARHFVRPQPEIMPMPDTSTLSAPFELKREAGGARGADNTVHSGSTVNADDTNGADNANGADSTNDTNDAVNADAPRTFSFFRTPVFSDFDYNGHMNNARYAEWITDAFWNALTPEEREAAPMLRRLEIKFRAEIPASFIDVPVELRGSVDPATRSFVLKGIVDRGGAATDGTGSETKGALAGTETVHFECEGEY